MTLAISKVNPFINAEKIQPVSSFNAQKSEENQGLNFASNPIKTLDPKKADEQLKTYSQCMAAYGMAQVAMQAGGAKGGGQVGTETSGSVG